MSEDPPPPPSLLARLLLGLVSFYQQAISPLFGPSCRFQPSCSAYAKDAIRKYGALQGGVKAGLRILRCNPLCEGGYDPA